MKYIFFLLLGVAPAACSMEAEEIQLPRSPLQASNNRLKTIASRFTCLNISSKDGWSLFETLKIRHTCLQHFIDTNITAIKVIGRAGLFTGSITSYNEDVMSILHGIFNDNADKENRSGSISGDFCRNTEEFFKDLDDLKSLIKRKEEQPEEIKKALEGMHRSFHFVNWMTSYYSNHVSEYLTLHR